MANTGTDPKFNITMLGFILFLIGSYGRTELRCDGLVVLPNLFNLWWRVEVINLDGKLWFKIPNRVSVWSKIPEREMLVENIGEDDLHFGPSWTSAFSTIPNSYILDHFQFFLVYIYYIC